MSSMYCVTCSYCLFWGIVIWILSDDTARNAADAATESHLQTWWGKPGRGFSTWTASPASSVGNSSAPEKNYTCSTTTNSYAKSTIWRGRRHPFNTVSCTKFPSSQPPYPILYYLYYNIICTYPKPWHSAVGNVLFVEQTDRFHATL